MTMLSLQTSVEEVKRLQGLSIFMIKKTRSRDREIDRHES
jgi:hypothetical protein